MQQGFLPDAQPEFAGYGFFDFYEPANQLGGDYYDYVPLPDGRLAVVLADVSGKGISAALLVARLSAEIRYSLASELDAGDGGGPGQPRLLRAPLGGPVRHDGPGRARSAARTR